MALDKSKSDDTSLFTTHNNIRHQKRGTKVELQREITQSSGTLIQMPVFTTNNNIYGMHYISLGLIKID